MGNSDLLSSVGTASRRCDITRQEVERLSRRQISENRLGDGEFASTVTRPRTFKCQVGIGSVSVREWMLGKKYVRTANYARRALKQRKAPSVNDKTQLRQHRPKSSWVNAAVRKGKENRFIPPHISKAACRVVIPRFS